MQIKATVEVEAERLARQQAKMAALRVPAEDLVPRATRTVVIGREVFDVMWDGT